MLIDLHTHSNASDGTDSPSELIDKAISKGLDVIALTDHDTVGGWDEAISALKSHESNSKMDLVLGSEVSCQGADGTSIHMLGLLFDPNYSPLISEFEKTRENRVTRMSRIISRLNEAGIEITIEEVNAQKRGDATLGRPHLADALVARGHVASREEAFNIFLHNGSKFYINHYSPSPEVAIRLIKEAGGVAVIAHPLASRSGRKIDLETLNQLIQAGLDGIEVDHRDHNEMERSELMRLAIEHNLVVTGSSDYHGTGKLNQLAEFTTHPEQWERLEAKAKARRVVSR
ncbi:MAG: PHP domain-containing protein [Candidatus Nanopelagicaceae bacterium]|nr:PHP domain-containing protein [Actinomycetota bacterium]NCW94088.1 PHP domain-containing protein [Actinomycetota bacterium]NCX00580.1 PHP domain-containing protein [Actinomycetota bacterium]NDA40324.1 PHP domain-containing protein [Actinomycetota bacterium]NDE48215.1 PHP domain-containing protein [Actinomycetota bacterium]